MRSDLVFRSNVVFEFYKAALNREITQDDFRKARAIVDRARAVQVEEITREEG